MIADILGDRMGCFLFQLPPSHRYTKARLSAILSQLDPARRNVVEFRHASWWNETVYAAFRRTGTIFCSCSGPRLPDQLVRTSDDVYLRLHGNSIDRTISAYSPSGGQACLDANRKGRLMAGGRRSTENSSSLEDILCGLR